MTCSEVRGLPVGPLDSYDYVWSAREANAKYTWVLGTQDSLKLAFGTRSWPFCRTICEERKGQCSVVRVPLLESRCPTYVHCATIGLE